MTAALSSGAAPAVSTMRHVVLASMLGTMIEWYDFLIYGTAAALVFNKLFFPSFDPFIGTLAAFGSYAVGFVARPLGGAIFGHYGDRFGRKAMLMLTMIIMGGGTFLIGCLPTYDRIGVWAPILLVTLRLLQGVGIGGEWGGAALMVIEHAGSRRGLYGSLVQLGFPLGVVTSTAAFALASKLAEPQFLAWGWRVPFLMSFVLVGVGLFVRMRLLETPAFQSLRDRQKVALRPLVEVVTWHRRQFLIAVGLKVSEVAWVYILTVFAIFYATSRLGLPRALILDGIIYAALLELLTIPLFGWLSDAVGRKPLYLLGALFSMAASFPLFWLIDTKNPTIILVTIVAAMSIGHGLMFGPQAAFFPELFGARVRYSGASLGCQVSAAISGGFAPIIATALIGWASGPWGVSSYMVALGLITLVATLAARETVGIDIAE